MATYRITFCDSLLEQIGEPMEITAANLREATHVAVSQTEFPWPEDAQNVVIEASFISDLDEGEEAEVGEADVEDEDED